MTELTNKQLEAECKQLAMGLEFIKKSNLAWDTASYLYEKAWADYTKDKAEARLMVRKASTAARKASVAYKAAYLAYQAAYAECTKAQEQSE
jgi:hypothetical protein